MTDPGDASETAEAVARSGAVGAAGGAAAAVAMSGLMLAAGRLGLMGEYPPERITRRALRHGAGFGPITAEQLDGPIGSILHVGFGAVLGATFAELARPLVGRLRRRLRAVDVPEPARAVAQPVAVLPLAGVAFGSVVWLVSYWGWVPALGILPPPDRDRPDRQLVMLAAHWVFGAVLGASIALLDPAGTDGDGDTAPRT